MISEESPHVERSVADKYKRIVNSHALESIFLNARSANGFLPRPIGRETLDRMVQLALMGPTSGNSLPMRLVFLESAEAKKRIMPAIAPGNVTKVTEAPVVAIAAADHHFYRHLPRTFPHRDMTWKFDGTEKTHHVARSTAWDNTLFQFAYLIVAARALGLDAGPIEGFNREKVDAEFFPAGDLRTTYILNLGYGDDTKVFERLPRFENHEIATYL